MARSLWILVFVAQLLGVATVSLAKDSFVAAEPQQAAQAMSDAAKGFLDALSPEQRVEAVMKFDDPQRRDWHNIPKEDRKGLQYRELSAEQQKLALAMLRAALSDVGYDKARKIMSLENNLLEGEKEVANGPLRDPERYFITIFGEPSDVGTWGWSFEGHHFSQNFVVHDGRVIGDTPSFWGANPSVVNVFVPGGPAVGTRTLEREEQLAFDLLHALDESQLAEAIVAEKSPAEYRGPGSPEPPREAPVGIAASKLNNQQQQLLESLLRVYCGNLAPELAEARLAEVKSAGLDRVYFAWLGAKEPGIGHSYRVQGPTFVLELVNVQNDPAGKPANHIHSVWRSLSHDFGVSRK